ncbi:2-amino-3-carboxymuconate-6-semialdehyde decarboxylase [Podospora australis]|uniref:6-methylsalicylate decarboxylase n=1 Tax=Podospora australis TaxID=1536484 RepID=A0AAN6WPW1_9PEZI|nr:2-amino-3-carboxymuconate-6-semialdehyde decarboxylase [Podospora australis]
MTGSGLIDVHFHALPLSYNAAVKAAGGDGTGFPSPPWSPEQAIQSMNITGSSLAVLSISAPGASVSGTGQGGRDLARKLNQELAGHTTDPQYEGRFAFFGCLPDWQDIDGTLAEMDFLFKEQKICSGVTVFTNYGAYLPSDSKFKPIWQKLQEYKALVFLHPTDLNITPRMLASGKLPQAIVDFPIAATRTAVDLVFNKVLRECPDVDIILSHAGGTLPFLYNRAELSMQNNIMRYMLGISEEEVKEGFRRFYHDLALSASASQINGLLDFTDPSHILFGSDYPYAGQGIINASTSQYREFVATNPRGDMVAPEVLRQNAIDLLAKHAPSKTD